MRRLWFRAFDRYGRDNKTMLGVILYGDTPSPVENTTRRNEKALGITPPRVYAYLSRLDKEFGDFGLALDFDVCNDGDVSPFDSGGLVAHTCPVKDWAPKDKQISIQKFSWPRAQLGKLLNQWPASDWDEYVEGQRPEDEGPHVPLKRRFPLPIWAHVDNEWKAWVWELRRPDRLGSLASTFRWTCSADELIELIEAGKDPLIRPHMKDLLKKHIVGGSSILFDECRKLP